MKITATRFIVAPIATVFLSSFIGGVTINHYEHKLITENNLDIHSSVIEEYADNVRTLVYFFSLVLGTSVLGLNFLLLLLSKRNVENEKENKTQLVLNQQSLELLQDFVSSQKKEEEKKELPNVKVNHYIVINDIVRPFENSTL